MSMFAIQFELDPNRRFKCDDCGDQFDADALQGIANFSSRVAPGEECPAGECPSCGALCHLVPLERSPDDIVKALRAMRADALASIDAASTESIAQQWRVVASTLQRMAHELGELLPDARNVIT